MNIIEEYEIKDKLLIRWSCDKEDKDIEFEFGKALAVLLIEEIVFINDYWWMKEWNKEQKENFSINVICSDVFAWGGADSENLKFEELEDLYEHYIKDKYWGYAVWCIKKRGYLPQKPVYEAIQKEGIWNLDKLSLDKLSLEDGVDGIVKEMKKL